MNVGMGKSFIMLKTSVVFMDPTFAKHLGESQASSAPPQIQQRDFERVPAKESKYLHAQRLMSPAKYAEGMGQGHRAGVTHLGSSEMAPWRGSGRALHLLF